MIVNSYEQIGVKKENHQRWIAEPTEDNLMGGHMEEYEIETPIMGLVPKEVDDVEEIEEIEEPTESKEDMLKELGIMLERIKELEAKLKE